MVKPLLSNINIQLEEQVKSPEQRLWRAVLAQAMYDLLSETRDLDDDGHRMLAECWISHKHKNFIDVCRNAGFDPNYVFDKAQRLLKLRKLRKSGVVWNHRKINIDEQQNNLS
jgi:hypothetical protein